MCFDPLTIGATLAAIGGGGGGAASGLGTALSVIGTAVGAVGAVSAGNQANAVGEYNATVAENNATAEKQRAAYEAGITRDRLRQVVGAQRAAGASSGLDVQSGTPVAVLGDTAKQGELDVLARLYSGESAARASHNDATMFRAQGKAQKQAGFINAASSLMTGFSSMASSAPTRYKPLGA
jgi:hypothetical protein